MQHNFKEGIDWIADPTGATPLANHIFVSKSGNDTTGDGSPGNPYLTVEKAYTIPASNNQFNIIVGTGEYVVSNLTGVFSTIVGDGVVIFSDPNNNLTLTTSRLYANNIVFKDYMILAQTSGGVCNSCIFINSDFGNLSSTVQSVFNNCTFINSSLITNQNNTSTFNYCKLINSTISNTNSSGSVAGVFFLDGYADENSIINSSRLPARGEIDRSNIQGIIQGYFTIENFFSENPKFQNLPGFDFTLQPDSPHIGAAIDGSTIGNGYVGSSFFEGIYELDEAINNNENVRYNSLGEIEVIGDNESETITLEPVEFEFLRYIGKVRISGFPDLVINTPTSDNSKINPNFLSFEMRYAQNDGVWTGWKKYRFNEIPSLNADGKSNAENGYNWADNRKIIARKYQIRLTILKTSYNAA